MKTAVLLEPNRMEIQEQERPEPGPEEALIRVRAVGICGSDTHYFAGMRDHEDSTVYPFVLGHEFAGEVLKIGDDVELVSVGQRLCCAPDRPCGRCEWCRKGEYNVCPNVQFAASGGVPGCLSEYYVIHESQAHPIPDSMGFGEATLAEPLGIGLHIVDNLVRPSGDETWAIIGAGPIGLVTTYSAKLRGADEVYVSDRLAARLDAARKMGAAEVCDIREKDFAEFVAEKTDGRGTDVAVEAAGEMNAIKEVAHLPAIHGMAVIEGIPPAGEAKIAIDAARRRELQVIFGRRSLHKTDKALELIDSGHFDSDTMITHEFPLDHAQEAFEYTRDYREG
ncbi:MAG: zinc-dependent alcohol dehydrogenase, partial [Planctomycetota bacterium]